MKVEERMVPFYIVGDKEFTNKERAEKYEEVCNSLLKMKFFAVAVKPDLTEGRGYYEEIIIIYKGSTRNALFVYLMENYGEPVSKVMGQAPIDSWVVSKPKYFNVIEEMMGYIECEVPMGIGDYQTKQKRKTFIVGDRAIGIEFKGIEDLLDLDYKTLLNRN